MKSGTKDQVEGTFHQVKGKVKEIAGKAIMNPDLEAEGKDENLKGEIQEKLGQVKKLVGKQSGVSCSGTAFRPLPQLHEKWRVGHALAHKHHEAKTKLQEWNQAQCMRQKSYYIN